MAGVGAVRALPTGSSPTGADLAFRLACAGAAAAVALAYANHFENSFHFDDAHAVENNLFIRDLRNVPRFFVDASTFSSLPANQSYRPLLTTTLALDHALGGLHPTAYHVDSFAVFLAQCAILLLLFRRILGDRWLALLGAALFGLHAAVAETVNYVIARGDLLSSLGAVASVWLFARGGESRRLHLYLVPMALGVLAKEQGAMAAPLLLLYVGLIEQGQPLAELLRPHGLGRALRPALPAFAVCGALGALALGMARSFEPGGASRWTYLATQPFATLHYATQFAMPTRLSADADWMPVRSVADARLWIGVAFVAATVWAAARASRSPRTRPVAFGLLWFFVALLPTSSLVPLAEVVNDHRMYFPFVGLALAAACGAGLLRDAAPRARPALAALAVLVLGAHAAGASLRNRVWRTEESLWRDVTEKSPGNGRGWMNYGLALMGRGAYPEAERCYRRALDLAPAYGYAWVNLAIVEAASGRPAEAEQHFRAGIRLQPGAPALRYFFARWLDQVGRSEEAAALLAETVAMSPADALSRQLLERIRARGGPSP
jgi:tetratricopeptide (TPR) repeat protein